MFPLNYGPILSLPKERGESSMHPIIQNILAVIAGLVFGSVVNMGIVLISGNIIPPPDGADVTTMEGLKASAHLFGPEHFIFPFLAHALGTLAGAIVTARMSAGYASELALVIGAFFLVGGIASAFMIPAPIWFIVLDLAVAYLPTSYLGGRILRKK